MVHTAVRDLTITSGTATQPVIGVPPSVNVTLPVGPLAPDTVAVKVTSAPAVAGLGVLTRLVVVGDNTPGFTTCTSVSLVVAPLPASPE